MAGTVITPHILILDQPQNISDEYLIKTGEIINEGDLVAIDSNGQMIVCGNSASPISPLGAAFFNFVAAAPYKTGDGKAKASICRQCKLRYANSTLVPSLAKGSALYLGAVPTATVSNYTCVKNSTPGANINAIGYVDADGTTLVVGLEPSALSGLATNQTRSVVMCLCQGFTPAGTGADIVEYTVPGVGLTFTLSSIKLRVNAAGGAPAITIEKSTGTGIFSATSVGSLTLGSGAYEGNQTSGLGTVNSGDKLRFNVGTLGTATGWTITVEMAA